jgi:hypothetical protein
MKSAGENLHGKLLRRARTLEGVTRVSKWKGTPAGNESDTEGKQFNRDHFDTGCNTIQ